VRVETEFLKPLRYGDRARVQIEVVEVGRASLTLRYELYRVPGEILSARATIKTVAINNETFASMPIPQAWRDRFERFRTAA
jgi:acyl-CoA thioesterase FadM